MNPKSKLEPLNRLKNPINLKEELQKAMENEVRRKQIGEVLRSQTDKGRKLELLKEMLNHQPNRQLQSEIGQLQNFPAVRNMLPNQYMGHSTEKCQCGQFGLNSNTASGFPWTVNLSIRKENSNIPIKCVGSLINRRYVLTAARCLCAVTSDRKCGFQDQQISLTSGQIKADISGLILFGTEISVPGNWADLGLLKLNENVEFNAERSPVCLDGLLQSEQFRENEEKVYVGHDDCYSTSAISKVIYYLLFMPYSQFLLF